MRAKVNDALSRSALLWLLLGQALVILPHLSHLPTWTAFLWLGCTAWRIQIYRMRARLPSRSLRTLLIALTGLGVYYSCDTLIGLDAAALLLVSTFIIKLLELRSRRDAQVLILLGFFVLVIAWLFDDSLLSALYSLLPLLVLLVALCALQKSPKSSQQPWQALRFCSLMLLQALPFALLLFVLFPRFNTPLWGMPMSVEQAITGLSDSMDVSDIAKLAQSDELVFRASFIDSIPPPQRLLYWRMLTLDNFDGKRWSQSSRAAYSRQVPKWQAKGSRIDYKLTFQPSYQSWLPMLEMGQIHLPQTRQTVDFRVEYERLIDQPLSYRASSWPNAIRTTENERILFISSRLPTTGNPRSRALAEKLKQTYGEDTEALVKALLERFRQAPYRYTLNPDNLSEDSIDSFLFDTQNGFCAHYAGASAFVLRAAGIPARLVSGYQGGEWNPAAHWLQVRQFDAHAWVEYWHPQKGWQRIDPTFFVAPSRIDQGLEASLSSDSMPQASMLSLRRYRSIAWLNQMRLLMEDLQYSWQLWVLGYQQAERLQLLARLDKQMLLSIIATFLLFLMLLAVWLIKPWKNRLTPCQREFLRFERLLVCYGLQRKKGEAPRSFAVRAAKALPKQAALIKGFIDCHQMQQYAGQKPNNAQLKQKYRKLRSALPAATGFFRQRLKVVF